MDQQLPNWLSAAVAAAGMTAYADDLYPKVSKQASAEATILDEIPPLH
jgi:hypothetical protein